MKNSVIIWSWKMVIFFWLAFLSNVSSAEYHNYQNGFGLDSQLALPVDEVGGQLEVQMAPVDYYSYIRRKELLMPLIADLIRFTNTNNEVTAYVLNVDQQSDYNSTRNDTVSSVVIETSAIFSPPVSTSTSAILNDPSFSNDQPDLDLFSETAASLDLFSAAQSGQDDVDIASLSLLEQNLLDLKDYCDISANGNNNFNNLSYNYIPKDLLEASSVDLFWTAPSPIASTSRVSSLLNDLIRLSNDTDHEAKETGSKTEENQDEKEDPEKTNKYLDCNETNDETEREADQEQERDQLESSDKVPEAEKSQDEDKDLRQDWFLNGNLVVVDDNRMRVVLDFAEHNLTLLDDDSTLEESELIDVLWKQDVDLGFSLMPPDGGITASPSTTKPGKKGKADAIDDSEDDIQKLKALLEIKSSDDEQQTKGDETSIWNDASIDAETGEYIPNSQLDDSLIHEARRQLAEISEKEKAEELENEELLESLLNCDDLLFSDKSDSGKSKRASPLAADNVDEDDRTGGAEGVSGGVVVEEAAAAAAAGAASSSIAAEDKEIESILREMMIQPFQPHPRSVPNYVPHHHHHGSNNLFQSPYHHHHYHKSRGRAMEHRWQDLANFMNYPPGFGGFQGGVAGDSHSHSHSYAYQASSAAAAMAPHCQFTADNSHLHSVLHNASIIDLGAPPQPHYGPNFSSAVSSSIHLTNSSSESENGTSSTYKMDHDMVLFSNTSSEMNLTSEGFLNSILADEDFHMDMGGAQEGMYSMRSIDHNSTTNNSTTSLIGATAIPHHGLASASGGGASGGPNTLNGDLGGQYGDRLEASSDSAVSSMASEPMSSLSDGEWGDTGSDSAQEYHQKYASHQGGYAGDGSGRQTTSIAQKKHHMFGKRYFQEQNSTTAPPATSAKTSSQVVPQSMKYDYSAYDTIGPQHGSMLMHPHANGNANGHYLGPHHPLTVDNMKNFQAAVNKSDLQMQDVKYSCSLDFSYQQNQQHQQPSARVINELLHHNHTYPLPPQSSGAVPKPQSRDKKHRSKHGDSDSHITHEHLTRDEKRAKALGIPLTVQDIINLPMDEFNERLSKYELSETQLSLIRDIRRRGKNKVAAQNCRKRKLDQILSLADEVKEVKKQKDRLNQDRDNELYKQKKIKDKFTALYRHVFQYLRDPDGNLYSSSQYSLQQSADGSVYLLPRDRKSSHNSMNPSDYNRSQNHTQDG